MTKIDNIDNKYIKNQRNIKESQLLKKEPINNQNNNEYSIDASDIDNYSINGIINQAPDITEYLETIRNYVDSNNDTMVAIYTQVVSVIKELQTFYALNSGTVNAELNKNATDMCTYLQNTALEIGVEQAKNIEKEEKARAESMKTQLWTSIGVLIGMTALAVCMGMFTGGALGWATAIYSVADNGLKIGAKGGILASDDKLQNAIDHKKDDWHNAAASYGVFGALIGNTEDAEIANQIFGMALMAMNTINSGTTLAATNSFRTAEAVAKLTGKQTLLMSYQFFNNATMLSGSIATAVTAHDEHQDDRRHKILQEMNAGLIGLIGGSITEASLSDDKDNADAQAYNGIVRASTGIGLNVLNAGSQIPTTLVGIKAQKALVSNMQVESEKYKKIIEGAQKSMQGFGVISASAPFDNSAKSVVVQDGVQSEKDISIHGEEKIKQMEAIQSYWESVVGQINNLATQGNEVNGKINNEVQKLKQLMQEIANNIA